MILLSVRVAQCLPVLSVPAQQLVKLSTIPALYVSLLLMMAQRVQVAPHPMVVPVSHNARRRVEPVLRRMVAIVVLYSTALPVLPKTSARAIVPVAVMLLVSKVM